MTTAQATPMRAWQCHAFGDYHDIRIEQVAIAAPADGEIQIRVQAFAPGFPDMLMVQGGYQLKPPLPFTPCAEFSGEVLAVGEGVADFSIGQAVMGSVRAGAAAERVNVPAAHCMARPAHLDAAKGAAFLVGYKTAWVGLVVRGQLCAGEQVLVTGAAGGVGLAAVDLAKLRGAHVIALAGGAEKCEFLRARGADAVVDTRAGPFREQVRAFSDGGVSVVYDAVGGDVFDEAIRCLAPFGRMLLIGFASGRIPTLAMNYALIKQLSIIGVRAGEYGRQYPAGGAEVNRALAELAAGGELRPHVHQRFAFSELPQAFDTIASRTVIGRVVVEV